jgi:hypothetical protein
VHKPNRKHFKQSSQADSGGNGPSGKTRVGRAAPDGEPRKIVLTKNLTVKELAGKLELTDVRIIKELFMMGHMRTVHQIVELEYAKQAAIRLDYEVIDSEVSGG